MASLNLSFPSANPWLCIGCGQAPGKAKVSPKGQGSAGAAPKKQRPLGPTPGHCPALLASPSLPPGPAPRLPAVLALNASAVHKPLLFMRCFAWKVRPPPNTNSTAQLRLWAGPMLGTGPTGAAGQWRQPDKQGLHQSISSRAGGLGRGRQGFGEAAFGWALEGPTAWTSAP